ncbi:MAG: amidohydrolase [Acidobacteria bacterium]|nr:amidohydrolase [Acidobacteriota bacterium]
MSRVNFLSGKDSDGLGRLSRRDFLGGLAVLGASAWLPSGELWAQAPTGNARRLDCHHHYGSPAWLAALAKEDAGSVTNRMTTWKGYSPDKAIEAMDKAEVATAFLSTTTPGVWFGNPEEARDLARDMNEYGAKMRSDHKGRFGLFAVLPLPDVEASLREMEYALDTLQADGVGLLTSYGNKWLGDPQFAPLFEELNRRKAVVYTHPTEPECCRGLIPDVGGPVIEYNTDTSRTIVSLIVSGTATRCPDINFIFSHAGGTIPYLVQRFGVGAPDTIADILARPAEKDSRLYHLRRFYYDTAASTNPVQMQALKAVAGASQIVFGADFPWGAVEKLIQGLQKCGFSAAELRGIDRENLLRILPQYKT